MKLLLVILNASFLTIGCAEKLNPKDKSLEQNENGQEVGVKNSSEFIPDLSVNGLFLDDNISIESQVGDLMTRLNHEGDFPVFYLFNSDASQFFKLTFFPGHSKNRFHVFEIGYSAKLVDARINYSDTLKVSEFVTETQVKLGMTKEDLIKKKGQDYIQINDSSIKYVIEGMEKSSFLKEYNMPSYFSLYEFSGNVLVNYSIGFVYP